jgi:uncharacterized membrane protein
MSSSPVVRGVDVAMLDEAKAWSIAARLAGLPSGYSRDNTLGASSTDSSFFDRFAERSARVTGGAVFFTACVLLVVLWVPSYFIFRSINTWQLVINTATTIITFLLVALLQNSQRRTEGAVNQKLDALADGLADLMHHIGGDDPELRKDMRDLRAAVGVEHVESSHDGGNGALGRSPSDEH